MQPILQIRQTPAIIGLELTQGSYSIRQPKADMVMKTTPGEWSIHQPGLRLEIDQSKARAAYTGGSYSEMSQRIYSGIEQLWLQGIAKRMEQGDRMAHFFRPGNTIADVYGEDWQPVQYPEIRGTASSDNVDIYFESPPIEIEYHPGSTDIQVKVNKPEVEYTRGNVNVYMQQYASIAFIPPELNVQI